MDHIDFDFSENRPPARPLRNTPSQPAPVANPAPRGNGNLSIPLSWLVIGLLVALLGYQLVQQPVPSDATPDSNTPDVVDQNDDLFGEGYLVFVREGFEVTAEQEMILRGADEFVRAKGMMGKRVYDDDQEAAKKVVAAASAKGIKPPCVAIVVAKEVRRVSAWPKTYTELEDLLK